MDLLDGLRLELSRREAEVLALRQAIAVLEGSPEFPPLSPRSTEYEGLGIVDAAKRFLREVGEPRTTTEIKDALLSRGWTTRSKNPTATVYATLDNSKQFTRTDDGRWTMKPEAQ